MRSNVSRHLTAASPLGPSCGRVFATLDPIDVERLRQSRDLDDQLVPELSTIPGSSEIGFKASARDEVHRAALPKISARAPGIEGRKRSGTEPVLAVRSRCSLAERASRSRASSTVGQFRPLATFGGAGSEA
jgi:hypothetical protein